MLPGGREASEGKLPQGSLELALPFIFSSESVGTANPLFVIAILGRKQSCWKSLGRIVQPRESENACLCVHFLGQLTYPHPARFDITNLWDHCSLEVGKDRRLQISPQVPSVPRAENCVKVAKIAMGWASVELGLRTTTFWRESVGNGTAHLTET